jgi:putative DNA methylase
MNTTRKKLIEVALPLEAINMASAREKSIRHGHPSTLHLWWARRPLAAARAVIFAQMVDDPSASPDLFPTEKAQQRERARLFRIIEDLVQWENTTNEEVLNRAREEIWQSWRRACAQNADHPRAKELFDRNVLPPFHDPFAGGGALPLEAQRLGLVSYGTDLNPVAVLINKAMIEIPPKFAGRPPVNPASRNKATLIEREWKGAQGLAEDVRYYGQWMRDEAEKRIGHLYPKVEITPAIVKERPDLKKYVGQKLTIVAWLWVRTVKSPNPAFAQIDVPLASSFILCPMKGKEAYVEPVVESGSYRFTVKVGKSKDAEAARKGTKSGSSGSSFLCLMSGTPMPFDYLRSEAKAGRMGARLMAMAAEGERGRIYLAPTPEMEAIASNASPSGVPDTDLPTKALGFRVQEYGMTRWRDLFTRRQLVALTTFSDLVQEAREQVKRDALTAGLNDDGKLLDAGGASATAYADAVATYLSFLVSRLADKGSTICTWNAGPASSRTASGRSAAVATVRSTFARQALPMTWDFAEVNYFSDSVGSIDTVVKTLSVPLDYLSPATHSGRAQQVDAQCQAVGQGAVISTDPPYYDNIGYADLSDFFYVWLRRSLKPVFPALFATVAVPKAEELVATAFRHGNREKAEAFFLHGMTQAMHRLAEQGHPTFPVTIYYAFKQTESDDETGTSSTGWDTFLAAVIEAGFAITGTWPMRTERGVRSVGIGTNALASSIVLVCRRRAADAPSITRREFITTLKAELPLALAHLQRSNIAPVDLAQAAIGPGMAVYTRYAKVMDAEGKPLSVREALALINETLDEALNEQEGDFDADSRWALAWFEQHGFSEGEFGVADVLARAKNTSVQRLVDAGVLRSSRGNVRLLRPSELAADWDPSTDTRLSAWESVHQLIRALESGGEGAAAELVANLGSKAELARELCYRLYTLCERKKRAPEALSYNGLVQSFPELERLSKEPGRKPPAQASMLEEQE